MEYAAVIRGVLVVDLEELHQQLFVSVLNRNVGCLHHPEHLLLMVDGEAFVGHIVVVCHADCLGDRSGISLDLFHF